MRQSRLLCLAAESGTILIEPSREPLPCLRLEPARAVRPQYNRLPKLLPNMSCLRTATSSLGHGARYAFQTRACSASIGAERAAAAWVLQHRSMSTRRTTKTTQSSRFQRSQTRPAETPADGIAREPSESASASRKADGTEPPASTSKPTSSTEFPVYPQNPEEYLPPPPAGWRKRADTSTKEYKRTERRVLSLMVALPFLIVTSYHLYIRLVLGKEPENNPFEPRRQSESQPPAPQS
ncbi:hypothetical protein VTK26DRAFT_5445 [Humicola hyalothermophila]